MMKTGRPKSTGLIILWLLSGACADRLPLDPEVGISLIENAVSPAWSPSGDYLMFERDDRLWVARLATGSVSRVSGLSWPEHERNGSWLADSEQDIALFVVDDEGKYQIRSGNIGDEATELLYQTSSPIEDVTGTADGPVIVFTRSNSTGLWRLDGPGAEPELIENEDGWGLPRLPRCRPDSPAVWYVDSPEEGIDNIFQIGLNGGNPKQLTVDDVPNNISYLSHTSGRPILAYVRSFSDPVRRAAMAYRLQIRELVGLDLLETGTHFTLQSITMSPDGNYLAYGYLDNYVRIVPCSRPVRLD